MTLFFIGAAIGAFLVVLLAFPFVAPWPTRVRWLLASQAPDPIFGLVPPLQPLMRQVTVCDVLVAGDTVEVAVTGGPTRLMLVRQIRAPASVVQLKRWYATG